MKSKTIIETVNARKIFDSRGNDAVEVDVITKGGFGRFSSPSGASTGKWEVQAYPNGGVDEAVKIVKEQVRPELIGLNANHQYGIDSLLHEIDDTDRFSKIGGNVALAISISVALAAASSKNMPLFQHLSETETQQNELPHPLGNILGGGMHAKGKRTDIQEFLSLPLNGETFHEMARANVEMHRKLAEMIEKKDNLLRGKGDEGAWIAELDTLLALEILDETRKNVENDLGLKIGIGLDMAASSLWNDKMDCYFYKNEDRKFDIGEQIDFVISLINDYDLVYVEDPVHEDDFQSFSELTKKASHTLLCGDDLFTTNIKRLDLGIKYSAGNAIIIKPNQVGTLSDTKNTIKKAQSSGYTTITSHRSGETCEPLIAHIAIAFSSPIIKTGVMGGERIVKINELIRIEEMMENAKVAEINV